VKSTESGVMHKMIVYDMETGTLLGTGYIVHYADGKMSEPLLVGLNGEPLPPSWFNLQMTDERWPVVVPMRIQ